MSKVQKNFLDALNTMLENVLYKAGQKVFFEAKSTVPIKTGKLKGTGTLSKIPGGFRITFGGNAAPYAGIIEDGRKEQAFPSTPYRYVIGPHKRKTSTGNVVDVKGHIVEVSGMRRVKTDYGWRTVRRIPAIKGTRFLKNALDKTLEAAIVDAMKNMPKTIKLRI